MRFDPSTYPGARPDGPTLVVGAGAWAVRLTDDPARPVSAPTEAVHAPVLREVRWSFAYGANANVERLLDKGMGRRGALLLPAVALGVRAVWEARRSPTHGAVPLTIAPATGTRCAGWALGLHPADTGVLDRSEGRGERYDLLVIGPVDVAGRWRLHRVPAYGPTTTTRVLVAEGRPAGPERYDQAAAGRALDAGAATSPASPPGRPIEGSWPPTRLVTRRGR